MSTDRVDGTIVDRGAQFLSTAYSVLPGLTRELGLPEWAPTSPRGAILRNGRLRQLHARQPWTAVSSGLVDPLSLLRLGYGLWRMNSGVARLSPADYADWHAFDDGDARSWSLRNFGARATDALLEPMQHGLYFHGLQGSSRAMLLAVLAFGFRQAVTATMPGGMGVIPEALARTVPVTLHCPVTAVRATGRGVLVSAGKELIEGDYAILATTAPVAARVYAGASATEQALMATPYAATINIAIATAPGYRAPRGLARVYGILFTQADRGRLAAIAIERNKSAERVAGGELLDVMLDHDAAVELMAMDDDLIQSKVLPQLETYFPGLSQQIAWTRVIRWPEAVPRSPVGRSQALHRYRSENNRKRKVYLAGDYMGFPWTDSAAAAGLWAARQILAQR
jgi:oxygen-dependent protoporphyrinogen oxidase